jgi:hypothetical protein
MSRFSELIDAVADQKGYSLTDVLLRAKVLSHHLSGRKFRQWVDSELNGYDGNVEVPQYRVVSARLLGSYSGHFGATHSNVPLSTSHLPSDMREVFEQEMFCESVSYIEDLVNGDGHLVGKSLDGSVVNYMRTNGTRISNMILNHVFKSISQHSLIQLLTNVRSRLLDFLLELRDKYPELDKDDSAVAAVTGSDVDIAVDRKMYQNCTVIEGVQMGDTYHAGQAGAMGPNAKAENISFVQILRDAIGQTSLADLASELAQLRSAMLPAAVDAQQDTVVAEVAQAEDAAKKGDASGVLMHLRNAGQWALEMATKIGASVAAKAIEKSMGM